MVYYNTIDLDHCDKPQLADIVKKISAHECCLSLSWKDSFSKGYHISITCIHKCDMCRLVFDDAKRFEMDNNRDEKFRNTLFTDKEYVRGNLKTVSNTCDRCLKYGNVVNLSIRQLTGEEMLQKLKDGKIKMPFIPFKKSTVINAFLMGYDFYECPTCKWFKFVNRQKAKVE